MVAAFDYCLHGKGGAAPLDRHRDARTRGCRARRPPAPRCRDRDRHRRRRRGADGEDLRRQVGGVGAVASSRVQLGLDIAAIKAANPQAIGTILGGHGITAWGDTSEEAERNSLWIIDTAQAYIDERGAAEPFGGGPRRVRGAARGGASGQGPGPSTRRSAVSLDRQADGRPLHRRRRGAGLLASEKAPATRLRVGTSCPDHFLRTKVKPLILDLPADAAVDAAIARLRSCTRNTAPTTRPTTTRTRRRQPPIRGADPLIVLVPGVACSRTARTSRPTGRGGGVLRQRHQRHARGAEALSTYAPISDAEKFRIEYWALEEAKLQRMPKPRRTRDASRSSRVRHPESARPLPPASPRKVRASSSPTSTSPRAGRRRRARLHRRRDRRRRQLRGGGRACRPRSTPTSSPSAASNRRQQRRTLAVESRCSRPREGLGPAARRHGQRGRSSSRRPRPRPHRAEDGRRRHIHLVEETRVRPVQQHRLLGDEGRPGDQVRLLAVELGEHGVRGQTASTPRRRARLGHLRRRLGREPRATYGVDEKDLGQSTPTARSSSARSCPRTSPTRSTCSPGPSSRARRVCTCPSTRASRRRSCERSAGEPVGAVPGTVRAVAAVDLGATSGRVMIGAGSVTACSSSSRSRASRTVRCSARRVALDIEALWGHVRDGLAEARAREPAIGELWASIRGRWTTVCSAPAACSPSRSTTARADRPRGGCRCMRSFRSRSAVPAQRLQFSRSNAYQYAADPRVVEAEASLLIPDLLAERLTGRRVGERTKRVDDGSARRAPGGVGSLPRRGARHPSREFSRRWWIRARRSGSVADEHGDLPVIAVRDRTTRRHCCRRGCRCRAERPPTSRAGRGGSSVWNSPPIVTGCRRGRTSRTRAGSTGACDSCTTSPDCGC